MRSLGIRPSSASSSRGHTTLSYPSSSSILSNNNTNGPTQNYSSGTTSIGTSFTNLIHQSSLSSSSSSSLNTNNNNNRVSNPNTSTLYLNNIILDSDDCSQSSLFKSDPSTNEIILCFQLLNEQLRNYIVLKKINSITHLYLENNNISKIEDHVRKLNDNPIQFIQYLNLSSNKLKRISLFNLVRIFPSLEFLILKSNSISNIANHSIPIYGNIKVLDLSCNHIKKIEGISPLRYSLQVLNIQKNEIESFQDMKQVLELDLLTNIDFRGNPIQSLDEENLIFEEILDKCSNVWFINGATTLASPLDVDDKFSSPPRQFNTNLKTPSNVTSNTSNTTNNNTGVYSQNGNSSVVNNVQGYASTMISTNLNNIMSNNGSLNSVVSNSASTSTEEKVKSAEELLKKHSYIIEHLKNKSTIDKQGKTIPPPISTVNMTSGNQSQPSNNSNPQTPTLYNDPAILKNLANFAKARSKRSDSCPTIPSPSKQEKSSQKSVTEEIPISTLSHSISTSSFTNQKENPQPSLKPNETEIKVMMDNRVEPITDRNTIKLMELKSFEQEVRNRQQARLLNYEEKFDLDDDPFLSNYQSILYQKKVKQPSLSVANPTPTPQTNIVTPSSTATIVRNEIPTISNSQDSSIQKEQLNATIENESNSSTTLQKLQSLIDYNAPPTPVRHSSPPKDYTQHPIPPSSLPMSVMTMQPVISPSSSLSSCNNSTLNISAIPHCMNHSNISSISMNLSSINASFSTTTSSMNSMNCNTPSNTPSNVPNRALSIKERAKQNMLKKLNM